MWTHRWHFSMVGIKISRYNRIWWTRIITITTGIISHLFRITSNNSNNSYTKAGNIIITLTITLTIAWKIIRLIYQTTTILNIAHHLTVNSLFYFIVDSNTARQRHSNLSAYGSTSLSMNQKDIYNKQNSNYNIITMKPK